MRSLLPTLVLAAPLWLGSIASPPPSQIPLLSIDKPGAGLTKNESLKVPGNSPAYLKGDPSKDILVLKMFNLIPGAPSRENASVGFELNGHLNSDVGAAMMRLSSTQTSLNGTILDIRTHEGPICNFSFEWIQDGIRSCEPKAGDVRLYEPRIGFLPLWEMPKCYFMVRAQLWDEKGNRMIDFEGMVYADGFLDE